MSRFIFFAFLLTATLLFSIPASGQHAFTLTIPNIEAALERPALQTPDGGFVFLFTRFVEVKSATGDDLDSSFVALAKFSADGALEWSRYFTIGVPFSNPVTLLQAPDGGFIALGTCSVGENHGGTAVFWYDAHGYLTSAKTYTSSFLNTDFNGGILLKDGSLLTTGYVNVRFDSLTDVTGDSLLPPPEAEAIIMHIGTDGEVIESTLYPSLKNEYTAGGRLHLLSNGEVALTGSIKDTTRALSSNGLVCLLEPDGTIRSALVITSPKAADYDDFDITDIIPNREGGYTLLGSMESFGVNGFYSNGIALALNRANDTLWTRQYSKPINYFLSSSQNPMTVIGQRENSYNSSGDLFFEYQIGDLGKQGEVQNNVAFFPLEQLETSEKNKTNNSTELRFSFLLSQFLTLDDGAPLIVGSKSQHYSNGAPQERDSYSSVLLTRLAPDFSSCLSAPEPVAISNQSIPSYKDENREEEETADAESERAEEESEVYGAYYDGSEEDAEYSEMTEERAWPEAGEEVNGYEADDMAKEEEPLPKKEVPFITELQVVPEKLEMTMKTITNFHTIDFTLKPEVICQQNVNVGSSAVQNESASDNASAGALTLSPNSVRVGHSVGVDFTLIGEEFPQITLLTVATGEIVRQVKASSIRWSPASGKGTARIETGGLAAGTYLVRVRSDEKQFISKLELR